ncbi:MAG: chemotaxis protein CheW [Candidatus Obscuribacterales bacterium]|nr:chemotaxis protein CheW [Candidatus Obscuribacterales bacterium]
MKEQSGETLNKPVWLHSEAPAKSERSATSALSGLTKKEILRARSRQLAKQQAKLIDEDSFEVAEFLLGNESYSFELEHLREVCTLAEVTYIPCSPDFVVGVINLRGQIIPIIDILTFLNITGNERLQVYNKAIIVQKDKLVVGILADEVVGAKKISTGSLQFTLHGLEGHGSQYLKGVTKERLVILDADKILVDERLSPSADSGNGNDGY